MPKKIAKRIKDTIAFLIIAYGVFLLARILMSTVTSSAYPSEYREAANIAMTKSIINGINPYSMETLNYKEPVVCYLYGPLMSLLAAGICIFTGTLHVQFAHYIISYLSILMTAVMIFFMLYDTVKSIKSEKTDFGDLCVPFMGAVLSVFCHWRYGYVYAAPDSLGLCISTGVIFFLSKYIKSMYRKNECREVYIYIAALLSVFSFFTKQYYIVTALTGAVFLMFVSKKLFIKYAASGLIFSALLFVGINMYFPLYWTYAVYFLKGPGKGAAMGKTGIAHNNLQISYLGGLFFPLFLIMAVFLLYNVYISLKKGKQSGEAVGFWDRPFIRLTEKEFGQHVALFVSYMLTGGLLLQYIGHNDGAFISYYLQLFTPALILTALAGLIFADNMTSAMVYLIPVVVTVSFLYIVFRAEPRLTINNLSEEEINNWQQAYSILDKNKHGNIYYVPPLAYHGYENEKEVYNDGQPFVITQKYLDRYSKNEFFKNLFPMAGDIMRIHLEKREVMKKMVKKGEYSLVTTVSGQDALFSEEELLVKYNRIKTLPLRTGSWSWDVEFWELK